MLEPLIFAAGAGMILLALKWRKRETPTGNFEVIRKTLETGSIVKAFYFSGKRDEIAELLKGKLPKRQEDPLLQYIQEAVKVGRSALISGPEVNRYLNEIEELHLKLKGMDKALRFRGRILSVILATLLPVTVRVIPLVVTHSTAKIGLMGETWMLAMIVLSSYFMTLDLKRNADLLFLGVPLLILSLSNHFVSRTLEPLLLRVLINPFEFING